VPAALGSRGVTMARAQRASIVQARPAALLDVAIAAAVFAGSLALLARGGFGFGGSEPGELDWLGGLLTACSTVPLVAWRRAPCAVFVVTASASVLLGALDYPIGLPLGPTAALYLFAASRDEQDPWTRRNTAIVVVLFLAYLGATALGSGGFPGSELFHTGLAWAVAWFAGERTRLGRAHVMELKERALRAEREAERERRLAVADERARIARDLHDAAGHAINVIAVRAGAARMRQDPERSQAALAAIESLARKTVADIDQTVGSLRDRGSPNATVDAPYGLASLDTLVARHAAAGLDVRVTSEGEPRQLDSAVDQAAYRILQEALTNAARHGTGAARVELAFGETAIQLTIRNAASDETTPRPNGGHGLVGMRERATLLGGSLETDRANQTFRVRARIPYEGRRA
jgi:signal transduction histidine kinase